MPSTGKHRGFTLIEMVVVAFIIALLSAVMVPRLFSDPAKKSLEREREKLNTLIHLAREDAVFESRDLALGFSNEGYAFYIPNDGRAETAWVPMTTNDDRMFGQRQLPEGHHLVVRVEDLELDLEDELPEQPQVFILSSGESTPFSFSVNYDEREGRMLAYDALGRRIEDDETR